MIKYSCIVILLWNRQEDRSSLPGDGRLSSGHEVNRLMKKKTLRSLFSLLMALVLGVSLLTGCSGKKAERAEMKEDAETIQVYLWTNSL